MNRSKTLHLRPALATAAAALAAALALALAASSDAAYVRGSSKGLSAQMHVGTHHPTVGHKWPLQFTATRGGRAARVTVTYEFLFNGRVVAVREHHTFTGHYSDALVFPSSAVRQPLTFRALVTAGSSRINLDYAIDVRR